MLLLLSSFFQYMELIRCFPLFNLVFWAGFQGADHSPRGHHRPHLFLLAGQLHPGGHVDHVTARRLRLPNGGMKTEKRTLARAHFDICCGYFRSG